MLLVDEKRKIQDLRDMFVEGNTEKKTNQQLQKHKIYDHNQPEEKTKMRVINRRYQY